MIIALLFTFCTAAQSQTRGLRIGTNIGGLSDYMTELPFTDLMHSARMWFTQNSTWVNGGKNPWNTEYIDSIALDTDGYPLSLPAHVTGAETTQAVSTIWADLSAWPKGTYTLLYDGTGTLSFSGDLKPVQITPGKVLLSYTGNSNNFCQMNIVSSSAADHLRRIRLFMPGNDTAASPFNPVWIERLKPFTAVRFMDWGATNSWGGTPYPLTAKDSVRAPWSARASMQHYTWATNTGVPYEMMARLCRELHCDAWICVPHIADDGYIRSMSKLLRDSLPPDRKLYIEYSNEIWNWMFGQAQWTNQFGCVAKGIPWPEGTVPYIQRCMDIFTEEFAGQPQRLVRVVGVQAAWQDVANRVVNTMRPGSFDAFAPAAYFGLSDSADAVLDAKGASATAADIVFWARQTRSATEQNYLISQKNSIALPKKLPMLFYEGGQHLTPHPFGSEPTYAQALLDVQRSPLMYDLYKEWLGFLDSLADKSAPSLFMNFSFIGQRSARYGSWGILETVDQDTALVPAPKYRAIMEYLNNGTTGIPVRRNGPLSFHIEGNFPNPFNPRTVISFTLDRTEFVTLTIHDLLGRCVESLRSERMSAGSHRIAWDASRNSSGVYFCRVQSGAQQRTIRMLLVR